MDDWLASFLRWAEKPCPTGAWLYRGQAARHRGIVPTGLRESHRDLCRHPLYDVDYETAAELLRDSPVFGDGSLYPRTIDDPLGRELERFAYGLAGGPPLLDSRLSFAELVRALAQHYGFPTLFVDVTLHPVVAALFATHRRGESGYLVADEEGVVYRWPTARRSASRLSIPTRGAGVDALPVIDVGKIHPHMHRPHNQRAALARPVSDPHPPYQPFVSPFSHLVCVDMAELPACETFRIPAGGGERLDELAGASMAALFPDAIDLGCSYLAVIGGLSMVLPAERELAQLPMGRELASLRQHALAVARTLLLYECRRHVAGLPALARSAMSLQELRLAFDDLGRAATRATSRVGAPELRALLAPVRRRRQEQLRGEAKGRYTAWQKALQQVVGEERAAATPPAPPAVTFGSSPPAWLTEELAARWQRIEAILESAEHVPIFALERPAEHAAYLETLPSSPDYERQVREQLAAQRRWLESDLFRRAES